MTKLRCNYKPRGYWTKELVIKEARKHSMLKKWRFAEPSSYSIACQKGWLDEASQHMKRNNCSYNNGNTQFRWTKELILKESKKFKKWSELMSRNTPLYTAIRRMGLNDEIKSKMVTGRDIKWTKEKVTSQAKKYKKAYSWSRNCAGSYQAAIKNGWYDEMKQFLTLARKPASKEEVFLESKKYTRKVDFKKGSYRYYERARKKRWLAECCSHMEIQKRWTKDVIFDEIKNYKTYSDFIKHRYHVVSIMKKFNIIKEVQKRMNYIPKILSSDLTKKEIFLKALIYKSRTEFKNNATMYYKRAKKEGWLSDCCKHMNIKTVKQTKIIWNKKDIINEVKKYQTRTEFQTKAKSVYRAAKKNGWLEECFSYLLSPEEVRKRVALSKTKWTKKEILKKIKEFNSWRELCNQQGLLGAINRYGLKKEIKKLFNTRVVKWTDEELKAEALKYDNKQKFRKEKESMMRSIYERGLHHKLFAHMTTNKKRDFLEIERLLLHPKIKDIFNIYKQKFLYEKTFILNGEKIRPDFIYEKNKNIYIIEAKSSYRKCRQTKIDEQVDSQILAIKSAYPKHAIIHILLSEVGLIRSNLSNFNMSLSEFSLFLKTGKYTSLPLDKKYKTKKELANELEKEFRNKIVNKRN